MIEANIRVGDQDLGAGVDLEVLERDIQQKKVNTEYNQASIIVFIR